jgi:hypothetical protein
MSDGFAVPALTASCCKVKENPEHPTEI